MVAATSWQLEIPLDAVIFDCDGTLSSIEGIDELAENNGCSNQVKALTADAMGKSGMNRELYQKRLDLVLPTEEQVKTLGQLYFTNRSPDVASVLQIFKDLNKKLYVMSAGIYPAVAIFADLLQIPRENIFAVNIHFDAEGHYIGFDETSPLVTTHGKKILVSQLKSKHSNIGYIGDGLNDMSVYDLVSRFIGYGGAYYRENIAALCQYYISISSFTPLLPLLLTQTEHLQLTKDQQTLYDKGLSAMHEKKVIMRKSP